MLTVPTVSEAEILAEVIEGAKGDLSPAVAREVLDWGFSKRTIRRINKLAELNSQGKITPAQLSALEKYLRVGALLNILQAKARLSLDRTCSSPA